MQLKGTCYALFAFDVGSEIDLIAAEKRLSEAALRQSFRHKRRFPAGSGGAGAPPVLVYQRTEPSTVGAWRTADFLDITLYEFGAMCLSFRIGFEASLEELVTLSSTLYENKELLESARRHAEALVASLGEAVHDGLVSEVFEDYVLFHVSATSERQELLLNDHRLDLARMLRAEEGALSSEETEGALATCISYGPSDVAVVDWHAALLAGDEMEDERRVLELANAELVELRHLDWTLSHRIDRAYDVLKHPRSLHLSIAPRSKELGRIALFQADSAVVHEGFDNALKLVGDDYLARLYQRASERFQFSSWDASIERKLDTLDSIYSKLADHAGRRRAEILEWIIILLIAVDIVLYFTPFR